VSGQPEHLEFNETDPSPVLAHFAELAVAGAGWINLEPGYDSEDAPPARSLLGQAFSSRGPDIPLCTWVPRQRHRHSTEPQTVGVHHGAGGKAVDRLAAAGIEVPAGWRVVQDHTRRGLVIAVPDDVPHTAIVEWLVEAGTALCPIPLSGWWRAAIHRAD
jgi:hypothetical protein